ncbi:MAG: PAS domain S-box protein [Verrucomicrobia bacterium]|nr:PAS domain S-box protein [Verrucomicrobiota bacterium]
MKRILIVDDLEQNRYLLEATLRGYGYETISAPDGAEALATARRHPPDLVISDILMPVMDGFALCREWRADERLRVIPFIFYTATYTDPKDEQLALDLGADRFVLKPQEPQVMNEIVRAVLVGGAKTAGTGAAKVSPDEIVTLREYNEALVRKLEKKLTDLEATHQRLQEDSRQRKEAEASLRESESKYRTLIERMGEGLVHVDDDDMIRFVNPRICQMLGYSEAELLGQHASTLLNREEDRAAMAERNRNRSHGISEGYEIHLRKKSGEFLCAWNSATPVTTADGQLSGSMAIIADITDRKRAEERSSQSQLRLESIIHSVDGIVWEADAQTFQFTFASQQAERILGYPVARWLNEPTFWKDHIHPEDRDAAVQFCLAATARLEAHQFEYRMMAADGRVVWLKDIVTVSAEGGRPAKLLGIMVDITASKRADAVKETMLSLATRLAAASTPREAAGIIFKAADQLWDWDAGTLDVYSPADDRVWAVMYYDIVDGKRREIPAFQEADEPSLRMRRIMRAGPELILRTPPYTQKTDSVLFGDTSRLSAAILCVPIHSQGPPVGVLSIQSYTPNAFIESDLKLLQGLADQCGGTLERIRATEALRASEDRLRRVVETIDEVVWVGEPGRIEATYLSPAFERIWGRTVASVMRQPELLLQIVWEEDRPRFLAALAQQAAGQPTSLEYRIVRPDGEVRWIWDRGVPLRDGAGRLVSVNGAAMDITERKQAEQKLARSHEQLRALLTRLRRTREEERTRVSREIHDELGQLLTGLKMDVRWLERKLSEPGLPLAFNPLLDRAVEASELADLIITTVQKIAAELRPGTLEKLGLEAALTHEAIRFQERFGVRCTVTGAGSWPVLPPEVANEMFYICQEALTNVVRHARATHVEIHLRTEDDTALLEVRDDGVGLAEAELNSPRSLGLIGMSERAVQCGGVIAFSRNEPRGTRVVVRIAVTSGGNCVPRYS